jgi:DNA polymerase I-like protein with 3'-5' exonuclease and polymerase domains
MISLDTETTGVDLHHGAKPFLVTTCNEAGEATFWEWDVDPETREPIVPASELDEVEAVIGSQSGQDPDSLLILQNAKFDFSALQTLWTASEWEFDWHRVRDTLLAGHLLASNQPHDLTTMALVYLGVNIEPYEHAVKKACEEARRIARSRYPTWRIAKKGLQEMPSAKESVSKFDMWLPRVIAREEHYPDDHPWWTVTSEYANADSQVTIALYKVMEEELRRRDLWEIYLERLKLLPIVYSMERRGITINRDRLEELRKDYTNESARAGRICRNIAADFGHELTLPKSGNNKSLLDFVFGETGLALPHLQVSKKTGKPSLDKRIIEQYESILPPRSSALTFIKTLRGKRQRDTALSYCEGYERFWLPWICVELVDEETGAGWYVLHPSLNPTGTDTLRFSSSNPNEQNISKKEGFNLRYMFGPAPGREWWSCDAQNIELRLPAYESEETELIDLFERSTEPPYYGSTHLLNFHTVYPDIWDKELGTVCRDPKCCKGATVDLARIGPHCKKKYNATWYQWCKNGGFAVQYGAVERENGTADKAFHRDGSHSRLKARFSRLEKLNQHCIDHANKHGFIETIPDKTVNPRRGYPLLCTRSKWGQIVPTVPLNYHIQGSAMWWMCKAMTRVQEYLDDRNDNIVPTAQAHIVMQVHDELVFDFPKSDVDPRTVKDWKTDKFKYMRTNLPTIRQIQKIMARGGDDYGIPTPVSCEYHPNNWSEGFTL